MSRGRRLRNGGGETPIYTYEPHGGYSTSWHRSWLVWETVVCLEHLWCFGGFLKALVLLFLAAFFKNHRQCETTASERFKPKLQCLVIQAEAKVFAVLYVWVEAWSCSVWSQCWWNIHIVAKERPAYCVVVALTLLNVPSLDSVSPHSSHKEELLQNNAAFGVKLIKVGLYLKLKPTGGAPFLPISSRSYFTYQLRKYVSYTNMLKGVTNRNMGDRSLNSNVMVKLTRNEWHKGLTPSSSFFTYGPKQICKQTQSCSTALRFTGRGGETRDDRCNSQHPQKITLTISPELKECATRPQSVSRSNRFSGNTKKKGLTGGTASWNNHCFWQVKSMIIYIHITPKKEV